jgi:hypothetical protein
MPTSTSFNPFTAAFQLFDVAVKVNQTMLDSQSVLAARMPILWNAFQSPLTADYGEINRMVTEKVDAFGQSARNGSRGGSRLKTAMDANSRDLGRMASGAMFWPTAWWGIAERNMAAASALMMLPGQMLAPIQKGAAANARRLSR